MTMNEDQYKAKNAFEFNMKNPRFSNQIYIWAGVVSENRNHKMFWIFPEEDKDEMLSRLYEENKNKHFILNYVKIHRKGVLDVFWHFIQAGNYCGASLSRVTEQLLRHDELKYRYADLDAHGIRFI
jgi:hypothetical protein